MHVEQVKLAHTPEEMRAEIFRLSYHNSLVRAVMDSANFTGMSSEDRYTLLAYKALEVMLALEESQLVMLNTAAMSSRRDILNWPSP